MSEHPSSSSSESYPQQRSASREIVQVRGPEKKRVRNEQASRYEQPPSKIRSGVNYRVSPGNLQAAVYISNPNTCQNSPVGTTNCQPHDSQALDSQAATDRGFSSEMATDPIFHMFPEPGGQRGQEVCEISDNHRFIQRRYPMVYMNLTANEHPSIVDMQYAYDSTGCPLCELDKNTLDSKSLSKCSSRTR